MSIYHLKKKIVGVRDLLITTGKGGDTYDHYYTLFHQFELRKLSSFVTLLTLEQGEAIVSRFENSSPSEIYARNVALGNSRLNPHLRSPIIGDFLVSRGSLLIANSTSLQTTRDRDRTTWRRVYTEDEIEPRARQALDHFVTDVFSGGTEMHISNIKTSGPFETSRPL